MVPKHIITTIYVCLLTWINVLSAQSNEVEQFLENDVSELGVIILKTKLVPIAQGDINIGLEVRPVKFLSGEITVGKMMPYHLPPLIMMIDGLQEIQDPMTGYSLRFMPKVWIGADWAYFAAEYRLRHYETKTETRDFADLHLLLGAQLKISNRIIFDTNFGIGWLDMRKENADVYSDLTFEDGPPVWNMIGNINFGYVLY